MISCLHLLAPDLEQQGNLVLLALLLPLLCFLEKVVILVMMMMIMGNMMIILVNVMMMVLLVLLNPLPFFLEKVGMRMINHLLEYTDDADGNDGKCP